MKHTCLNISLAIVLLSCLCGDHSANSQANQSPSAQDANALVESIRKGDLKAVESLLAAGADVNAKTKDGETALAAAAGTYKGSGRLARRSVTTKH